MLLMVTANDIDIEPRLTYDLLTSTEMFAIDKYSGKMSLTGKLDYETRTSHNVTVMVGNWDLFVTVILLCTGIDITNVQVTSAIPQSVK